MPVIKLKVVTKLFLEQLGNKILSQCGGVTLKDLNGGIAGTLNGLLDWLINEDTRDCSVDYEQAVLLKSRVS